MPASSATAPPASDQEKQTYHVLIIEDFQGKRAIPLTYATYSVGRDERNTIVIQDPAVSRHHIILIRMPLPNRQYCYRVVDGDANGKPSLNGIMLNNAPCKKKDLEPGDNIRLGEVTSITYHLQQMTPDEFEYYFKQKEMEYRSIQEEATDPVGTMTTILAR